MTLHEYRDLEQGSDEWLQARCGILTASVIGQLVTPKTLKPADNPIARGVIASLVAERITGHVEPTFVSDDMMRGIEDEPRARDAYAEHQGVEVAETGFMVREENGRRVGFSPDGLVGTDGLIEIKSRRQRKHMQTVLADAVPLENVAQIQTGFYVTGRDWCDYVSYCGGMKLWIKRVHPDPRWFDAIAATVDQFEQTAELMTDTYLKRTDGLPMTERAEPLEIVI